MNNNYDNESSYTDLSSDVASNLNPTADQAQESSGSAVSAQADPSAEEAIPGNAVSARKQAANRANARKSTGPRTAAGKEKSRRNALRHGFLSRSVLFDSSGQVIDPELFQIRLELLEFYSGDIRSELAIDQLLVELYRQRLALKAEGDTMAGRGQHWVFYLFQKDLALLHRYTTASQKAYDRLLSRLDAYLAERLASETAAAAQLTQTPAAQCTVTGERPRDPDPATPTATPPGPEARTSEAPAAVSKKPPSGVKTVFFPDAVDPDASASGSAS